MEQLTISCKEKNFLDSKCCPDCTFIVGADFMDVPEEITGHKAIFANASPVFRNMFFGGIPEKEVIKIPDVHPDAFHVMVNFFYTRKIKIVSVQQALDVWYVAEKYGITKLTKCIPNYLTKNKNITPQNVCYILQVAILYRNNIVQKKCHEIIKTETLAVLNDASFLNADISTLSSILDQENLNVFEIDLFRALVQYDYARKDKTDNVKTMQPDSISPGTSWPIDLEVKEASVSDENIIDAYGAGSSYQQSSETPGENPVKELVKKIRFLTMTPEEFAECVGMSSLISPSEAFNILVNISTPHIRTHPMPEGYCTVKKKRTENGPTYWVSHAIEQSELRRYSLECIESSLLFKCSAKIKIKGVKLNNFWVVDNYSDYRDCKFYFEVTNGNNKRLLNIKGSLNQIKEIRLNCPVYIDRGKYFTIKVILSNYGGDMFKRTCKCLSTVKANVVTFHFARNSSPCECNGIIRAIFFTPCEW